METLKYSPNKLMGRMAGAGASVAAAIYLFSNQEVADSLPIPFDMFGGEIGHYFVLPFVIASSAVLGWLAASRLIAGSDAVECLPDEVRVTTFWGRTRIRWADLGHVYLERKRKRFQTRHWLVFHYVGKGLFGSSRLKLRLDDTDLEPRGYEAFREAILATKRSAEDRPAGAGLAANDMTPEPATGEFDPDAALARYLARKAAEVPQGPPAPPSAAARPTFGRKGL